MLPCCTMVNDGKSYYVHWYPGSTWSLLSTALVESRLCNFTSLVEAMKGCIDVVMGLYRLGDLQLW